MSEYGFVNLRGDGNSAEFVAAITTVLGQGLPVTANTMTTDKHRVFWLGPDEWLVVTHGEETVELLAALRQSLSDHHVAVTDVSGGNVLLRLGGVNVRDVLAKGCTLDFHPDEFPVGCCAQSGLAKVNVLIGRVNETSYDVIARRSFSDYLARWLENAGAENVVNSGTI